MNHASWYRLNGTAFFLNFYYQTLAVDEDTLRLIGRMPSSYAAMSTFEFFAELYALYYDQDDPGRQVIPADVATWLDTHVGRPTAPQMPRPRQREAFETITRPGAA